ncbi:hypothetical protein ACQR16_23145 [Bradyrhizobium oligotrophicum]|uniref:hypothetical protein n=1 Tax=Bradyrhizobium oligotrophicum TaxID=44255 RepID=UPI003EBAAE77
MFASAVAVVMVLVAAPAFAAGGQIIINGCTTSWIEGCTFLNTPAQRYALLVNPPKPAPGRGVTVRGVIDEGINICMFQPAIKVLRWNYNRMRCPKTDM